MPETDGSPLDETVQRITERLAREMINGRPLRADEFTRFRGKEFVAGWEFSVQFPDKTRRLQLLIHPNAPWEFSRVALVDAPEFLSWPHVERDGILCLRPTSWIIDPTQPGDAALQELASASELIERLISDSGEADFRDEFRSYWDWTCNHRAQPIFCVAKPVPPSRQVHLWRGQNFFLVGDTPDSIIHWLRARFPGVCEKDLCVERAGLI